MEIDPMDWHLVHQQEPVLLRVLVLVAGDVQVAHWQELEQREECQLVLVCPKMKNDSGLLLICY